jgi:outer membrane protein assembly factor BamB
VALIAVSFIGSGCAASWRAFGYDRRHFSVQPSESTLTATALSASPAFQENWRFVIPASSCTADPDRCSFTASPSVYDNTVYIGGRNGVFYAIYATGPSKGTLRWQYPPSSPPTPADACGTTGSPLVITTGSGNPSGPGIASTAAIVDNVAGHTAVLFAAPDPNSNGGDGRLWALDAGTGQCIWRSQVLGPTSGTSKIGYSSPAIAHGRAYVGVSAKRPDNPITIGRVFAVDLANGNIDTTFNYASSGTPAGGGVWSSPAVTPSGNIVITTGNSCLSVGLCATVPAMDYTNSMLKLDWHNGNVLWQIQPVDVQHDHDPDWAVPPVVGQVSCGSLAMSVQKDGYVHAADIKTGGPFSNPACSYTGHSLECPRWSFPPAPNLPFQDDGHGDTRFIRPGALDGDHLVVAAGGLNLADTLIFNRLYSLNVCASDADRIRWMFDVTGSAAGGVSIANHIIYVGASETYVSASMALHRFYALADTDVLPPTTYVCSYPSIAVGLPCSTAGFRNVPVPRVLRQNDLIGSIPGIPAIANGQVFVATAAGRLYGLIP